MQYMLECWSSHARPQQPFHVVKTGTGVKSPPECYGPLPIAHPDAGLFASYDAAVEHGKRELHTSWAFRPVVRLDSGRVLLPADDAPTYRGEYADLGRATG